MHTYLNIRSQAFSDTALGKVARAGQLWRSLWDLGFRCQRTEVLNPDLPQAETLIRLRRKTAYILTWVNIDNKLSLWRR